MVFRRVYEKVKYSTQHSYLTIIPFAFPLHDWYSV